MKKIIILGKVPPPYIGSSVATEVILKSNLKDKFDLIHLDTSDHRDIQTLGKIDLGNIFSAISQYFKLFWLILTKKPDAVYVPSQQTTIGYLRDVPFVMITKLFGKKLIFHLHGGNFKNWYDGSSKLMQWVVKKTHRHVDAQIVLGEILIGIFDWLMPEEKIFVVANGHNFTIPSRNRDTDEIKILYLGNYIRTKGVLDALYSSEYLKKYGNKVKYNFVGSWGDEKTKKDFEEYVLLHPEIAIENFGVVIGEAKYRMLVDSDIFVFPTYYPYEGHPYVIIEAMAAGLTVISTDHGAIRESVAEGVNGFLIDKNNPQQIADKISFLIENPAARKKMGEESRRLYLEKFTENSMIRSLEKVFDSL